MEYLTKGEHVSEKIIEGAQVLLLPMNTGSGPKSSAAGGFCVVFNADVITLHSLAAVGAQVKPFMPNYMDGMSTFQSDASLDNLWLLVYPKLLITLGYWAQMGFRCPDSSLQLRDWGRQCLSSLGYCDTYSLPFTIRMPVNPGGSFVTGARSSSRHSRVQLSQSKVFEASEEDKKLHSSGHPVAIPGPANDRIPDPAKLSKLQEHLYTQAGILRIPKSSREGNRYPVEPHTLGPSPLARS